MTKQFVTASQAVMPIILMETDVNAVTAGGDDYGWVSGTPASLAGAATAFCLFDLGPNWMQYSYLQAIIVSTGPSSGLGSISFTSRDDATATSNFARQLGFPASTNANGSAIFAAVTGAVSAGFTMRPIGRYLVVRLTNADATNAQGASKVTVAAYPF